MLPTYGGSESPEEEIDEKHGISEQSKGGFIDKVKFLVLIWYTYI